MVTAILLGAGLSQRMGRQKLNLPLLGRPLYEWSLQHIQQTNPDRLIVVASHELIGIEEKQRAGLEVYYNDKRELGLSHSFSIALSHIDPQEGMRIALFLSDKPFLYPDVIRGLLDEQEKQPDKIIRPMAGEVPGHPVVFPSMLMEDPFFRENGLGRTIKTWPERVVNVEVPWFAAFDIDTREEYERAKSLAVELNLR